MISGYIYIYLALAPYLAAAGLGFIFGRGWILKRARRWRLITESRLTRLGWALFLSASPGLFFFFLKLYANNL